MTASHVTICGVGNIFRGRIWKGLSWSRVASNSWWQSRQWISCSRARCLLCPWQNPRRWQQHRSSKWLPSEALWMLWLKMKRTKPRWYCYILVSYLKPLWSLINIQHIQSSSILWQVDWCIPHEFALSIKCTQGLFHSNSTHTSLICVYLQANTHKCHHNKYYNKSQQWMTNNNQQKIITVFIACPDDNKQK